MLKNYLLYLNNLKVIRVKAISKEDARAKAPNPKDVRSIFLIS
jgi:hypothetical protein